jgi:hypothetical protein
MEGTWRKGTQNNRSLRFRTFATSISISNVGEEAWDELAAIHAPQDRQTQLHLICELHTCKMLASTSLKDHEATFSSIVESLAATGKTMDKMDIITMYLLSLLEQYSSFPREVNTVIKLDTTFSQVRGLVRVQLPPSLVILSSTSISIAI